MAITNQERVGKGLDLSSSGSSHLSNGSSRLKTPRAGSV